jgi:4-hydroxy-2-oxoheptanedioate aldolase
MALDQGRPWGVGHQGVSWSIPIASSTTPAKAKLLSGQQVFSFTQSTFNPEQYCNLAPHLRLHLVRDAALADALRRSGEDDAGVSRQSGATPMIRMPDALEANMQKAYDLRHSRHDRSRRLTTCSRQETPRGTRGFRPSAGAARAAASSGTSFLNPGETYRNSIDDNVLSVVMIETLEGVDNAYEIASTPGIDVVILGQQRSHELQRLPADRRSVLRIC